MMSFKLASHFARHASHAHHSTGLTDHKSRHPAGLALGAIQGASRLGAGSLGALAAGALRFSDLPGLGGGLPQQATNDADSAAKQQLKIQQDIFALMTGQGINVIVKNLDGQAKFG